MIPLDTNGRSDEIERLDLRPTSESPTAVTKRKSLVLDDRSPEPKRVCIEPLLPDLDTLNLVDDSGARGTLTPKTTEDEEQNYLTSRQPTAGGLTALVVSTSIARLQHASSSSTGASNSISVCGSSIGSLFGRPTTHAYEPWWVWSLTSPRGHSVRSLGSVGMPAPMLEKVDEELLLSRVGNDLDKPRYWDRRVTEIIVEQWLTRPAANRLHVCIQGPSFASSGSPEIRSKIQDWSTDESTPGPGFAVQAYSCPAGVATISRLLPAVSSSVALTVESLSGIDSSFVGPVASMSTDLLLQSSAASDAIRQGPMYDEWYDVDSTESDAQFINCVNIPDKQLNGVRCLFEFLNCAKRSMNVEAWNKHCKIHLKGNAPPRQLRCPYSSCLWTNSGQDGDDAWNKQMEHLDEEHDILLQSDELYRTPDVPLLKHLWSLRVISDK